MAVISKTVVSLLESTPSLLSSLKEGTLNANAVARKLKPEVEAILGKEVQLAAIAMAIRRAEKVVQTTPSPDWLLRRLGNLTVHSGVTEYIFETPEDTKTLSATIVELLEEAATGFSHYGLGSKESIVVCPNSLSPRVERALSDVRLLGKLPNMSVISINLPRETLISPGIYSAVFTTLSVKGINVIEAVSLGSELSLLVSDQDADRTFTAIKQLSGPRS